MSSSPVLIPHSEASPPKKKQKLEKSSTLEPPSSEESPAKEKQESKGWVPPLSKTLGDKEAFWKMCEDVLDDQHEMTAGAKLQQNSAAVRASRGFDVPSFPGVSAYGIITSLDLNDYNIRLKLLPVCLAAIKYLYEKKHVKLELLILEKVNTQIVNGIHYYHIIFEAYNPVSDASRTVKAVVSKGGFLKRKIMDSDSLNIVHCEPKVDFGKKDG